MYGNLSKHDDILFRALSISPMLFMELIFLMVPFALSLGLPFGFSLAVIFCVGRWSADREILAMQSLGMGHFHWIRTVLCTALVLSFIGCFGSLHWAPVARNNFDQNVEKMIYQDLNRLAVDGKEIQFSVNRKDHEKWFAGSFTSLSKEVSHASLNIGQVIDNQWRNIRLQLFDQTGELRAILHAKRGSVDPFQPGCFDLNLEDVDIEKTQGEGVVGPSTTFVSFEKWKNPLRFQLSDQTNSGFSKYVSIFEFFFKMDQDLLTTRQYLSVIKQFNKYGSLAFSSAALAPVLIFCALFRGRRETYANLFLGLLLCLVYFLLAKLFGEIPRIYGTGWWLGNVISLILGIILLKKFTKS
jgi:lipopolysaccharide export LptBFGC system permease protein LptF